MVRAAAKNFRDVLVVVDPADYPAVLAALDAPGGPSPAFRFDLARKAFAHTAAYDAAIAATLGTVESKDDDFVRPAPGTSVAAAAARARPAESCATSATARTRIRRRRGTPTAREGFGAVQILQGKELSFTNLLDLDSAARIVLEFSEPAAAVIKHTNPCGAATGDVGGRRLRARARSRCARRLRRHRRAEPPDRRGDRAARSVHVHRGGDRARRRRGCAADAGEEGQHARGRRWTSTAAARRPLRPSCGRFSAPCSCSSATWLPKAVTRGPDRSGELKRRDEAAADRGRVAARCGSRGASART